MTRAISNRGHVRRQVAAALSAVATAVLQRIQQQGWRRCLLFVYLAAELVTYRRFRLRLARLHVPHKHDRRGTIKDLEWIAASAEHSICPLTFSKESFQRFLDEQFAKLDAAGERRSGDIYRRTSWQHYYETARECFCIAGPSPEEHALLLRFAHATAKRQGLEVPPANAPVPTGYAAPVAYGSSPIIALHKPLPVELMFAATRCTFELAFLALGYRARWMPTPEGWIRYWIARPRVLDPSILPAVFIHGVGLGAGIYIPFLERLRTGRQALLVVVEMPNNSRSHFQDMMPTAASFRHALERLLAAELDVDLKPGQYVLIGHSLGTDCCAMVMNDPRLTHSDSPIRPGRLVLLDPVCFAQEVPEAHRLPFWTIREAFKNCRDRGAFWPLHLLMLLLVIRDEYNQEACKRFIVPGTDALFRCSPALLRRCRTLVCLSGRDQALPAWRIHDYLRAQFPDIELRMDPTMEHGGFLVSAPGWISRSHAETVLKFLGDRYADLPRVSSEPGSTGNGSSSSFLGRSGDSRSTMRGSRSSLGIAEAAPQRTS